MSLLSPQQLTISTTKFVEEIKQAWQSLAGLFNGGISFGDGTNVDNISGAWALALSVAGNFVVNHNLGRTPVGWFVVSKDGFEDVKLISKTSSTITLAGQNGGVNLTLFIF
jgi:hypothetical protein